MDNLEELKKQTQVDNSKLEEMMKEEITPQMQIRFFNLLRKSQLYLPITPSANMFEGIENAKEGDVFQTDGPAGFDINYLSDEDGNRAVPLFTSEEAMDKANMRSSVMVMFAPDIADLLKQSDRYSVVAVNPFTEHDIFMPIEGFLGIFDEDAHEEEEMIEAINEILEVLRNHSYVLENEMAFMVRLDENSMRVNAVDGVFIPDMPMNMSTDKDFRTDLKYANIIIFEKGKKVLPLGKTENDVYDTIVAPGTEFILEREIDEFTTLWRCGNQPFYD